MFISLYEFGYLFNDVYSIKYEDKPNKRLGDNQLNPIFILLFVLIRLVVFFFLLFYCSLNNLSVLVFFVCMSISFLLHNVIQDIELKYMTFISLAFFRALAIVFPFLTKDYIMALLPAIILHYVVYRGLNYLDSKSILSMKSKKELPFKIYYYLLLLPISIVVWALTDHVFLMISNAYFLLFWCIMAVAGVLLKRIRPGIDIKKGS
ncbi:MAG: hypothetical protein MUF42_00635 [Cytophagaceae bacterium]|nr:hypothetical protein [Cytophagaceae bacterium]